MIGYDNVKSYLKNGTFILIIGSKPTEIIGYTIMNELM